MTARRKAAPSIRDILSEREIAILQLRFPAYGDGYSQAEIGKMLGISQRHVGRVFHRTCCKIRRAFETFGGVEMQIHV